MGNNLLRILSKPWKLQPGSDGGILGLQRGREEECQNPGIIKIWISKQFPEFPDFIDEVREVRSEWNPLISGCSEETLESAGVNSLGVIFGRMRIEHSQEVYYSLASILEYYFRQQNWGLWAEAAFNTPLRREGYFTGKNVASQFGKIKRINVFCKDARKATRRPPRKAMPRPSATSPVWLSKTHGPIPALRDTGLICMPVAKRRRNQLNVDAFAYKSCFPNNLRSLLFKSR